MKESLVAPRLFIYEPHLDYLVQRSHLPAVDRFLPQNTWWDGLVYYLICDLMAGTNETEGYITSCENASVPFQSWQLLFSAAAGEKVLALANVRDLCPINGIYSIITFKRRQITIWRGSVRTSLYQTLLLPLYEVKVRPLWLLRFTINVTSPKRTDQ